MFGVKKFILFSSIFCYWSIYCIYHISMEPMLIIDPISKEMVGLAEWWQVLFGLEKNIVSF